MVTDVNSTTITVQWGPVEPCNQQNGAIISYSVRYGSETVSVSGDSMITITGLTPSTTYSIQVAAETNGGTGVYSSAVEQLTNGVCVHSLRLHIVELTVSVSLSLCSNCDSRLHNSHHHLSLLDQWGLRGCQL